MLVFLLDERVFVGIELLIEDFKYFFGDEVFSVVEVCIDCYFVV